MNQKNSTIVIVAAKRTAVGNFNGTLASLAAHDLGAVIIKQLLNDTKIDSSLIDEVIMGQVLTAAQGQNPARQAALEAGLPIETPAWIVNQVCGSGLKSVILGYMSIMTGNSNIIIAGGQESMSNAPHASFLRNGIKMGNASLIDTMVHDGLWDIFNNYHMGITAENIAKKWGLSRQEQDQFALLSQQKAEKAQNEGRFTDEIAPITISSRKGEVIFANDEFIRQGTVIEALNKLKPAFEKDGTVTAGNSSGINDGAAAVMIMSLAEAEKRGLKPLVKIVSFAQSGVDPKIMGTGPIKAVQKALAKANWSVKDLDLIEANEAFAAQAMSVNKELGFDNSIVNVNGGAIAIGHPIGASGTRILVTLIHEMQKRNTKKAVATLCIGGGMGIALCIENCN
jgi:acetyl-CoA C-acetyltransferase